MVQVLSDTGGWMPYVAARQMAAGQNIVTFGGGLSFSPATTIPHGLPSTPAVAMVCSNNTGFPDPTYSVTWDATNIYVYGTFESTTPGAGAVFGFNWLAFT